MDVPLSLDEFIQSLPNPRALSWRSLILLIAYHRRRSGQIQLSRQQLVLAFAEAGLPPPRALRRRLAILCQGAVAPLLSAGRGQLFLSAYGVREVEDFLRAAAGLSAAQTTLAKVADHVAPEAASRYFIEAMECVRHGLKRAAVVMVWILAVDHVQRYVLAHRLADFNQALARRQDLRGLQITKLEDFADIRDEQAFIDVLRAARIATNDARKVLEQSLGFRNSCAHPSSLEILENKVIVFIEELVHNIILKLEL